MAFIMLRHVPSIPNLLRVFIMKGCCILSSAFSASIEIIIWLIFHSINAVYRMYWFTLWGPPLHPGTNPIWSWCVILLMWDWIWFANTLLRFLQFFSSGILACSFLYLECPLSGFEIRIMLLLLNKSGSIPSSSIFWRVREELLTLIFP